MPHERQRFEDESEEDKPRETAYKVIYIPGLAQQEPQQSRDKVETEAIEAFRALADRLCEEHPSISTYKGIFGGIPHLKDVRLSVADILSHLYVLGSISAILERYAPDITEEQIKEAIAYAQDFLEEALHSRP
jgi:uncharacterized protein (DUF433 family)